MLQKTGFFCLGCKGGGGGCSGPLAPSINPSLDFNIAVFSFSLAAGSSDTGAERRLQDIVARRKLVDLAKAQAQEVAVLRAEVERLRMRTFPALVQVER